MNEEDLFFSLRLGHFVHYQCDKDHCPLKQNFLILNEYLLYWSVYTKLLSNCRRSQKESLLFQTFYRF